MAAETKSIICYEPKFSPSDIIASQEPVPTSPSWPEVFSSEPLRGPEDGMISPVPEIPDEREFAASTALHNDIPELHFNSGG